MDIGNSWCKTHAGQCTWPNSWNGFDLYVLHITNRNIPGPKPVFWYEAGIHSREIATIEVADRYMSLAPDQYNTNPDSHWLVDYTDIWVMPHVNPDGHHIVEDFGNVSMYQRKNADKDDGCSSTARSVPTTTATSRSCGVAAMAPAVHLATKPIAVPRPTQRKRRRLLLRKSPLSFPISVAPTITTLLP